MTLTILGEFAYAYSYERFMTHHTKYLKFIMKKTTMLREKIIENK